MVEQLGNIAISEWAGGPREGIRQCLSHFCEVYPRFHDWLELRLDQVEARRSFCDVAVLGENILGVWIETPKGKARRKICTIFVDPVARNLRVGESLFVRAERRWDIAGVQTAFVTVPTKKDHLISSFLRSRNFSEAALERSRYGDSRDELIYMRSF
jgi:ribosomal protein S18 acetylase RimI-like enzyme